MNEPDMKNSKKPNRRGFLNAGIKKGVGLVTGIGAIALASQATKEDSDSVRMIASDGTVYEIDKQRISKMCGGKISNARLKKWLEDEQNINSK